MKSKALLKELIDQLDTFEADFDGESPPQMTDFLGFLNSQYVKEKPSIRKMGGNEEEWIEKKHGDRQVDISILVTLLFRYAKGYIKKALLESPVQTPEEFSFMIVLLTFKSLTKTELIQKNVLEKTSGTEIIKRLLKQEMIKQFDDPEDKRSQRVAITEKGRAEVIRLLPRMQLVSNIVAGNLTEPERITLSYLLNKLDHYHYKNFTERKDEPLENLL